MGSKAEILRLLEESKALRKSKIRAKAERELAAECANVAMWWWTIEPNLLVWDQRMCDLFGVPLEEPKTYQTFIGAVIPEDRARVQAAIDATLETGVPYLIDYSIRVGGSIRLIHARGKRHPEEGPADQLVGVCLERLLT